MFATTLLDCSKVAVAGMSMGLLGVLKKIYAIGKRAVCSDR